MHSMDDAFRRIDDDVAGRLRGGGSPGLSLAITDRERTLKIGTYGFADLAARTVVSPNTVFEIGSIGKSFTALVLLRLAERGAVVLDAPVSNYLPWFSVRSTHAPITIRHLLSHTAGIVGGSDVAYDGRYESWALRETEVSGPPGERFHYSNVGYKTLGYLIEDLTGKPYGEIVRTEILSPLGMDATVVPITNGDRPRMAVGYRWLHDDRPGFAGQPAVPATWIETATADGSVASTPNDMARYLRMLLAGGDFESGRIISPDSYAAFTTPNATRVFGRVEAGYGLGISMLVDDGHPIVCHGGGMVGYHSFLAYDLAAGIGVIAMVNGPGDPMGVALAALRRTRVAVIGGELPPEESEIDPFKIENPEALAGEYYGPTRDLRFWVVGGGVEAEMDGRRVPLRSYGDGQFILEDPSFAIFPLGIVRDDDGIIAVHHGPEWFSRAERDQPPFPDFPSVWEALPGHYRCHNPWSPSVRIILRRGVLLLVHPDGNEDALVHLDDGTFRVGDESSPERVRFDAIVTGKALRLNLSGQEYFRSPLS